MTVHRWPLKKKKSYFCREEGRSLRFIACYTPDSYPAMGHISMAVDNPNRALVMALISHISPHWTRSENISSTGLFFFLLSTKWMQHSYFAVRRISLEIKKTSQSKCKHNNKNNRCCLSYQWTGSNGQWAEGGVLAQVGTPSPITGEIRSTSRSCWTVGATASRSDRFVCSEWKLLTSGFFVFVVGDETKSKTIKVVCC